MLFRSAFIEFSDVIFAVDSVPAIFALTNEPFIVFTSNVFAILGLRSMYFLLAGAIERFHRDRIGLQPIAAPGQRFFDDVAQEGREVGSGDETGRREDARQRRSDLAVLGAHRGSCPWGSASVGRDGTGVNRPLVGPLVAAAPRRRGETMDVGAEMR